MLFSKSVLLAAGLTLALATGAIAQAMGDKAAIVTDQSGKVTHITRVNAKGHATIMKHGKKLAPGTVIYRSGDDVYALEGKALEQDTSQTLTDHAKGWID